MEKLPWPHLLPLLLPILLLPTSAPTPAPLRFPKQPEAGFQQFSGYITVGEDRSRSLFYYLAEAAQNPGSSPLVLWLNGGPGCSSFGLGAMVEHGPFRPRGNDIIRNHLGWNQVANMLYLESPAGVGFSYSKNATFYDHINDEITGRDNLEFLRNWLEEFGEYRRREMYIAGESYAGHYVPQLARLLLQSDLPLKLIGVAMGNPLLDFDKDLNSRAEYLWSHGAISDRAYASFTTLCNYSRIYRRDTSPECFQVYSLYLNETGGGYFDRYDVTLDVCLAQSAKLLRPQFSGNVDVCLGMEASRYLNRKNVKKALRADLVGVDRWTACSQVVRYDSRDLETPMAPTLAKLVQSGLRLLVYSGDQDSVIPLTGSRAVVNRLAVELKLKSTDDYRPWFHKKEIGGWTQSYGRVISFATIRGAAHEAPFSQPGRSLEMIKAFLKGEPLPYQPA